MNFDENLSDYCCGLEEMSRNAAAFLKSYARTCTVSKQISEVGDNDGKANIVKSYLDFCYNKSQNGQIQGANNVVDLPIQEGAFECITSNELPNIRNYSVNSLLLVEFFTHCCINCIHSIEDIREVHEEIQSTYQDTFANCSNGFKGLNVLSVHSPKFPREKDTESIKAFCKRMKMDHSEVINDPQCILWNELGVTCWPTLLILGPNVEGTGPNLLFTLMGEGHKENITLVVKTAMEYFMGFSVSMRLDDQIDSKILMRRPANFADSAGDTFLKFPGKLAVLDDQIIVSDSGNNRIVVLSTTGNIEKVIGGPRKGNKDGSLADALFYNPQGIALESKYVFYVADTGNHSIRKVDLQCNQVSTLIKGNSQTVLNDEKVMMKSPWDLTFYDPHSLIIASAGSHRLFGYFFKDTNLLGVRREAGTFSVIAGSGREENRNNSYILKASFAQPSGITVVTNDLDMKTIYIADSESSSIRSVTPKCQVVGVVGGSRDPTDLFAFGDADGKGINVRLQHPMGVCSGTNPSEIYIADTYNHKVKRINVETKECETYISSALDEPSGICKDPCQNRLYVADTNNHSIKTIDLETGDIRELAIIVPVNMAKTNGNHRIEKFDKEFQILIPETALKVNFVLSPLPDAYEGGHWKVLSDSFKKFHPQTGEIEKYTERNEGVFSFEITNNPHEKVVEFFIVVDVFYCSADSCLKRTRKIRIMCDSDHAEKSNPLTLSWENMSWEK